MKPVVEFEAAPAVTTAPPNEVHAMARRTGLRRLPPKLETAAIVVAVAVAGWVLLQPSPIPDSYWALIWGQDVLGGNLPQVDLPGAPSAHPLAVAVGAVVGLFGPAHAVGLFNALVLLSLGSLLVGVFRLGQIVFGTAVAWVAVAVALCNFTLANVVMFSSLDVTAFAMTVWASVLVAERPQRGVAPLILVGIAGLQRPEVWLLSAAYWLYLAVSLRDLRRMAELTFLAAAPVACWVGFDLIVSGGADRSLNQIRAVGVTVDNGKEAPLFEQIRGAVPPTIRVPFIPLSVVGVGLAFYMRRKSAIVPAAVGLLGLAATGVYFVADIIIVGRFFVITALMSALFIGYVIMGGAGKPGNVGRAWRIGGVLAALIVLAVGARQADGVRDLRTTLGDDARASAQELTALLDQPRVAQVLDSCTPVWMQARDPGPVYRAGIDPSTQRLALTVPAVGRKGERPDRGALLGGLPTLGLSRPASSYRLVVPAGFSRVGSSGRWTLYERGC